MACERRERYDAAEVRDRLGIARAAEAVGVEWDMRKSRPAKRDFWACCPLHEEATPSFHVDDRRGFYKCFGCGARGDALGLVMAVENLDFRAALRRGAEIAGVAPDSATEDERRARAERQAAARAARVERMAREDARDAARKASRALEMWRAAYRGPELASYLAGRGVDLELIGGVPASLRQAVLPFSEFHGQQLCMIAPVQQADGTVTGTHRTFLAAGGRGKLRAPGQGVKKMFGNCWGGAIRLGPVAPRIAIAEGIESALGWLCLERAAGREAVVWAAGARGNQCEAIELPDEVRAVVLLADNDTDSRVETEIAMDRGAARLRRRGLGVEIRMPPRGMDFLDLWNAKGEGADAARHE